MSRVGSKPIALPKGVTVQVDSNRLQVKGPKGELTTPVPPGVAFKLENGELVASRSGDLGPQRALHGLARALANNAVRGVTEGFVTELDIVGVGFKAVLDGKSKVVFSLGYSHPMIYNVPEGISIAVDATTNH